MRHLKFILMGLSLCLFITCQKEEFKSDIELDSTTLKNEDLSPTLKRGGKKDGCTEQTYSYAITQGDVFTGSGVFTTCINVFRGFERILGTRLTTNWACLTNSGENETLSNSANLNCGGFVELYYKPDRYKYRVELSGDTNPFSNACAPDPGTTICLDFKWMQIGPDGRHNKDCITTDEENPLIDIGLHTICVENITPIENQKIVEKIKTLKNQQ